MTQIRVVHLPPKVFPFLNKIDLLLRCSYIRWVTLLAVRLLLVVPVFGPPARSNPFLLGCFDRSTEGSKCSDVCGGRTIKTMPRFASVAFAVGRGMVGRVSVGPSV